MQTPASVVIMRLFIFFGIWLLIDLYAFQTIKTLTSTMTNVFLRRGLKIMYWLCDIVVMTLLTYIFLTFDQHKGQSPFSAKVFAAALLFFLPKLILLLPVLLEDITRISIAGIKSLSPKESFHLESRRKFISQLALGLAAIPFLGILHGMTRGKYSFRVIRQTLYFPDLPEAFDGFTITQLSDLHAGSFDDFEEVKNGIELANEQKSDLFVFTGDMVNNIAAEAEPFIPFFQQVNAKFGKFSVLGNHDYGDYIKWSPLSEKAENMKRLKNMHEEMGFKLMMNEHVSFERDGQFIKLAGIENWGKPPFPQHGDLSKALDGIAHEDFTILLSHDPSHFEEQVKSNPNKIHLTMAGHTHGMQFGIEIPGIKWSPVKWRYPRWAGHYEENGRNLYVNRGFGFLGVASRVGIWPEITVFTLKRGIGPKTA